MSVMRPQLEGSLFVVVLCTVKLLTLSVKWLMGLVVKSVMLRCRRDVCLVRNCLMVLHGGVRVRKSHSSGVARELVVLLELSPASIGSARLLPSLIHWSLVSKDV
jgi:hypothetical protein